MPSVSAVPRATASIAPADRDDSATASAGGIVGSLAGRDTISVRGATSPTLDGAARDALRRANPLSVSDNREYGGLLVRDAKTGTYSATPPARGNAASFDLRTVSAPRGTQIAGDYHTHGDYSTRTAAGDVVRTGKAATDTFSSDRFSSADLRGITADAAGKAPGYAGYLGTPGGTQLKYDPATATTSSLHATGHAAAGGALAGATAGALLSTASALRSGHFTRDDAASIAKHAAAGGAVGAAAGGIERTGTALTDRVAGLTVSRVATSLGGDEVATALARTVVSRVSGATIAGTVASAGISAYENRAGLARGDSRAIGTVAGDTAVGLGSALAGAATGGAIGSVVPVAGTIVGAGVGLVAGYATDNILRAGGVDTFVGHEVSDGVGAMKRAFAR